MRQSPNINNSSKDYFFLLVQLSAVTVFLGRAWQHIYWDAPFRTLFWDEELMSALVNSLFGMSWETYITSATVDANIQALIQCFGWFYLGVALLAIFVKRIPKWAGNILLLGSLSLIILAALYCKEKFFSLGQFFEYALQYSSAIFLYLLTFTNSNRAKLVWWMKVAIALTFTCHGLYALNYYPRPGNFVDMTLNILPISEAQAYQFLNIAGVLDFVVSIAIFFNITKLRNWSLCYAVFWGFATSLARVWANFYAEAPIESLQEWLHESLLRSPHFLIPLAVYFYYKSLDKTISA